MVIDNLDGRPQSYLIGTGTGARAVSSGIKDTRNLRSFPPPPHPPEKKVSCCTAAGRVAETRHWRDDTRNCRNDRSDRRMFRSQLIYYSDGDGDPFRNRGRITDFDHVRQTVQRRRLTPLEPEHDRVMIWEPATGARTARVWPGVSSKAITASRGQCVVEKAFAER